MNALSQTRYGGADRLSLVSLDPLQPRHGELLVDVGASAVTQGDRRIRTGAFPGVTFVPGRLAIGIRGPGHRVPGTSYAGRVAAVGPGVSGFKPGDRVFGSAMHGAHATQVCVRADGPVTHTPVDVADAEAAALVYGGVTAVTFLCDMAQVASGERVCVLGASGGVGRVAVQLAKALGAHVTGVCSAAHADLVRGCGADVVVDYAREAYDAGEPYDVILDTIGVARFRDARRALTPRGRYLSLIVTTTLLLDMLRTRRSDQRAFTGAALGGRLEMDALAAFITRGALRAHIAARVPLERAVEAHVLLDQGNPGGELVLDIGRA